MLVACSIEAFSFHGQHAGYPSRRPPARACLSLCLSPSSPPVAVGDRHCVPPTTTRRQTMPLVRVDREVLLPLFQKAQESVVTITQFQALAPTEELKEELKVEPSEPIEELKEEVKQLEDVTDSKEKEPTEERKEELKVEPSETMEELNKEVKQLEDVTDSKEKEERAAGTGFIVHCSDRFTVVGVHPSFKFQGQNAIVTFWDGTRADDCTFIKMSSRLNLIVVNIRRGDWQEVKYGQVAGYSENVLSVVSLFTKLLPFIGRITSPCSVCVNANGVEVAGTRETFTFNLPLAGVLTDLESEYYPHRFEFYKNYVIGAPIFNFNGRMVGFVDKCGIAFDFKYGVKSEELRAVMYKWLDGRPWKDAIEAHMKIVQ